MKKPRRLFISTLIFMPALATTLFAGEDQQQTKPASASQKYFENSSFAVDSGNIGNTNKLVNFEGVQKVPADAAKYSPKSPDFINASLAPAHKIQVDKPTLDLLKTKFEGPNVVKEEGIRGGQIHESSFEEGASVDITGKRPIPGGFESAAPKDAVPQLLWPRAKVDEAAAIDSLETLVSSQEMFYQGSEQGEDKPPAKYTLFMPEGAPARATVNLKMSEGQTLKSKAEPRPEGSSGDAGQSSTDNDDDNEK